MMNSPKESGNTAPRRAPAAGGPNFAVTTKIWCVVGSRPMFRDPGDVVRFCTTVYLSG